MSFCFLGAARAGEDLSQILKTPLITGASVSADQGSLSPGKKLALKYTTEQNIKTLAFGGRPGAETIKSLDARDMEDRSAIVAIDFLFWDSTLISTGASLNALKELMAHAQTRAIPIVLGEIPELILGKQPGRTKLNVAIAQNCAAYKRCYLMPLNSIHQEIQQRGYWQVPGRRLSIRDIIPDGLHLSDSAGDELSRVLLETLTR